jgi:hypothetical protein
MGMRSTQRKSESRRTLNSQYFHLPTGQKVSMVAKRQYGWIKSYGTAACYRNLLYLNPRINAAKSLMYAVPHIAEAGWGQNATCQNKRSREELWSLV